MALNHRWGWCVEGCPLGNDTTWGTDETLTVTTHTVLQVDKDLYIMIVLLILLAHWLLSLTRTLKRHGTHVTLIFFKNKLKCPIDAKYGVFYFSLFCFKINAIHFVHCYVESACIIFDILIEGAAI